MYVDRARRSISIEARQANLIDQIAQFNEIPKKYEIKFDLSNLIQEEVKEQDNGEQTIEDKDCVLTLNQIECAPIKPSNDTDSQLQVKGTQNFLINTDVLIDSEGVAEEQTYRRDYDGKDVTPEGFE